MPTYRELLQHTKGEISEIDAKAAQATPDAVWVDVREADEWQEGHLPGAVHVPRGYLESRIEGVAPDKTQPVILYCAAANRSAFAAKTLLELGYENVHSLAGGFTDWKRNGLEIVMPRTLSPEKRTRYSRHLLIPEIGEEGQLRLLDSKILLIGAGGLGSPASLYLAAAGIGTLGIVDADIVDVTNLQRQIAHSLDTLGTPKVDSAKRAIAALNPDVNVVTYRERLDVREHRPHPRRRLGFDRRRRRQLPDALPRQRCDRVARHSERPRLHLRSRARRPCSSRTRGRATAVSSRSRPRRNWPRREPRRASSACSRGSSARCRPPRPSSCCADRRAADRPAAALDALATEFSEVKLRRDAECPVCGEHPTITEYIDYVEFWRDA